MVDKYTDDEFYSDFIGSDCAAVLVEHDNMKPLLEKSRVRAEKEGRHIPLIFSYSRDSQTEKITLA
jgi:hypothetical protein